MRHLDRRPRSQLGLLDGSVLAAMRATCRALRRAKIPHAVVGPLAVMAHGYYGVPPRFEIAIPKKGDATAARLLGAMPERDSLVVDLKGQRIRLIVADAARPSLVQALRQPVTIARLPFTRLGPLVETCLARNFAEDRAYVVELVKCGVNVRNIKRHLCRHAPGLLPAFENHVGRAAIEPP